jgi:hypothetical protein
MIRAFLRALVCVATFQLGACTTPQQQLQAFAAATDAVPSTIHAPVYDLQAVAPKHLPKRQPLTVYIEGDGHAWATATQPSLDPSPHLLDMARLALDAGHPGVYLARPCQFIMNANCQQAVWTDARFSAAVVAAMQAALNALKAQYQAPSLELIGYSGGATIALLVAEGRDDVTQIQTIAGNLDPQAWVEANGLSPLKGSEDPLQDTAGLSAIAQRHFSAMDDKVVPGTLTAGYLHKVSPVCAQQVVLPGTHASILQSISAQMLNQPIICQ